MAAEVPLLGISDLLRLMAGDPGLTARVAAGETLRLETPFRYPGRRGAVVVHLAPVLTPGPEVGGASGARPVRISDGGDLLKSLEEQGMDLAVDMILSKTVFHAVRETAGGDIIGGEVCIESAPDTVAGDLWRFLQLMAEIMGLRHSKYKDAMVRLSRRQDAPDLSGWDERPGRPDLGR